MTPGEPERAPHGRAWSTRTELGVARLLALPLEEASVKVRTGPPDDGHGPDAALGL